MNATCTIALLTGRHPFRPGTGIRHLLFLLLIAVCPLPASAASGAPETESPHPILDLIEAPSQPSMNVASSILMGVTTAGNRLIAVGERGYILVSDDAGRRWQQVQTPVQVTLTAVAFPTPTHGWAVGHDGVILSSDDGGQHWTKRIDGRRINTLMLENLQMVIAAAEVRLETATAAEKPALETRLENLAFFLDDLNLAVEEGPTRPLMDVWFKDVHEGIVVGAFGTILKTADGGNSWAPLLDRLDNPDGFHYYAICHSGGALYLAGEAGILFRSDDGGALWTRLESPYEGSFFGIAGNSDGSMIVAFGLRASLFVSRDRGVSWTRRSVPTGASISGGRFLDDGTLFLTCIDGTILYSRDGESFTARAQRFPGAIALCPAVGDSLVITGVRGVNRINIGE